MFMMKKLKKGVLRSKLWEEAKGFVHKIVEILKDYLNNH